MLTSLSKRIETLISIGYLQQVMRGKVYRLYYREGLVEKWALLRPREDANGAHLINLLEQEKIKHLGREYSERYEYFKSEETEETVPLENQGYAIVMRDGKLRIEEMVSEQSGGRRIATIVLPSFNNKIEVTCFQTVRLAYLATFCRFVFFMSLFVYCGQKIELFSRLDGSYAELEKNMPQSLRKVY